MTTKRTVNNRTSELALFARLLQANEAEMSAELARYLLTLGFEKDDRARMEELAARNQDARLSPEEAAELQSYVKAGHLLALLQSMARKALKQRKVS
jgi:hypothetical protein